MVGLVTSVMIGVVGGIIVLNYVPMKYYYGSWKFSHVCIQIIFHVLLALLIVSYLQTVFTDPGTVPADWNEQVSALANPPYAKCRKCGIYKPPRSHFDSVTRRLVLEFDHFCPWVNNAVGFFNRKFFVLFVTYVALATTFAGICLGVIVWSSDGTSRHKHQIMHLPGAPRPGGTLRVLAPWGNVSDSSDPVGDASVPTHITLMTLMAALIDGVFGFAMLGFGGFHWWMAAKLQTTIEGAYVSRPFDLGTRRNLEVHFGKDARLWFLPVWGDGPNGDGVHWQRHDGTWDGVVEEAPTNYKESESSLSSSPFMDASEEQAVELVIPSSAPPLSSAARERKLE